MRIEKITNVLGRRVYTDLGDYFGEVEEVNLFENKISGWRIRVAGELSSLLGGARGVIIPHQFVKAISDIFIISHNAIPNNHSEAEEDLSELI